MNPVDAPRSVAGLAAKPSPRSAANLVQSEFVQKEPAALWIGDEIGPGELESALDNEMNDDADLGFQMETGDA